jgi:hypothetical protein
MTGARKVALLALCGVAFGVLVAVVKGEDVGVRDALGNTSAPWMLVPFLAGTRYARVWHAALAGIGITLAAFVGFYVAEAAILDLGPHPWTTDLRLTLGSGQIYEKWGVLTGAAYGALGGLWASRRLVAAPVAIGLAFVCEPLIVLLLWKAEIWGGAGMLLLYPWMWISELVVGVVLVAGFMLWDARTPLRTA